MKNIPFVLLLASVSVGSVICQQAAPAKPLDEKRTLNGNRDTSKRQDTFPRSVRSFFGTDHDVKLVLSSSSAKAQLLIKQAQIFRKATFSDTFVSKLRRAIAVAEDDTSILATVTNILTELSEKPDCQLALDFASSHLERYPATHSAFASRARAKSCVGDLLGAFDDLTNALKIRPEERTYLSERAFIPFRISDVTKALELYQIIIDHNKNLAAGPRSDGLVPMYTSQLATSYANRSYLYKRIGDKDKQLADLSTAVETYPSPNLRLRATAYHEYKMFDLALSDITAYIGFMEQRYGKMYQRDVSEAHILRAKVYEDAGRFGEAIADYLKAIDLNPANRVWIETQISRVKQKQ